MPTCPYKNLMIVSKDIDKVEEFLCEAYAPASVIPLGKHDKFGVNGQVAVLDEIFFEWSTSIGSYQVTPVTLFDAVLFNFVDTVGTNYIFDKEKLDVSPGQVIGYKHADHVDVLDRSKHVTVVISDTLLAKRLSTLLDRPVTHPLEFHRDAISQDSLLGLSSFIKSLNAQPFKDVARLLNNKTHAIGKPKGRRLTVFFLF